MTEFNIPSPFVTHAGLHADGPAMTQATQNLNNYVEFKQQSKETDEAIAKNKKRKSEAARKFGFSV